MPSASPFPFSAANCPSASFVAISTAITHCSTSQLAATLAITAAVAHRPAPGASDAATLASSTATARALATVAAACARCPYGRARGHNRDIWRRPTPCIHAQSSDDAQAA